MSDKYIIRNCPNITFIDLWRLEPKSSYCKLKNCGCENYTDCLLKKIVEKCRNYKENCKIEGICLDERLCSTCFLGGANELGEWILDDLGIEECE